MYLLEESKKESRRWPVGFLVGGRMWGGGVYEGHERAEKSVRHKHTSV